MIHPILWTDGTTIMVTRWLLVSVIASILAPPACARWGTMEEAEQLFTARKQEFVKIYDLVNRHRELRDISPYYEPDRSIEFIPKYGEFTDETRAVYADVLERMERIGLQRVVVKRFTGVEGGPMELVEFVVFDRGIGGNSEGILISRVDGDEPIENSKSPETVCRQIDNPNWYVCHSR